LVQAPPILEHFFVTSWYYQFGSVPPFYLSSLVPLVPHILILAKLVSLIFRSHINLAPRHFHISQFKSFWDTRNISQFFSFVKWPMMEIGTLKERTFRSYNRILFRLVCLLTFDGLLQQHYSVNIKSKVQTWLSS